MKIKNKKHSSEERIFQFFFFIFTLCFIVFLIFSNLQIEKKKREFAQQFENLKLKIQELEERKKSLETAISQIQNRNYWENLAREEGYVKEGEETIVIKKIESEKGEKELKENYWLKIWQGIKNLLRK